MTTMSVPKLRFPEFRDEWKMKKLGDFASVSKLAGYEFTKHVVYSDFGELIGLRGLNIKNNTLDLRDVKYIDRSDLSKLSRSKLFVNDLMFTYVGTVGEVALIPENDKYYLAPNVSRIRVETTKAAPIFIQLYFLNSRFRRREIEVRVATSSQPALSMENVRQFKMALPTLLEQKKIAEFLTAVDKKVELMRERVELLKKYKIGVMQKIFSQQIRFKDDSGKGFPEWRHVNAGEVFKSISNKSHDGDLPILAITQQGIFHRNSLDRKIDSSESGIKNYKIIEPGDFVISLRSFQGGIEMSDTLGISSPAYTVMRPLNDEEVTSVFYKYFLKKESFISQLNGAVIGIREGKQISYEVFANLKIPLPTFKEQQKIADFLAAIDDKVELEEKKLEQVKRFKKALLQQMFV